MNPPLRLAERIAPPQPSDPGQPAPIPPDATHQPVDLLLGGWRTFMLGCQLSMHYGLHYQRHYAAAWQALVLPPASPSAPTTRTSVHTAPLRALRGHPGQGYIHLRYDTVAADGQPLNSTDVYRLARLPDASVDHTRMHSS